MQMVITFMAVVAGLIFSVAVVFRLFFVQQPAKQMVQQTVPAKIRQKR